MSKVLWHTMMSLDGFIAGPNDDMQWVFGDVDVGDGETADEIVREIVVHVAPVLLGDGVRLFERADAGPVRLDPILSQQEGQTTVLRYGVRRGD